MVFAFFVILVTSRVDVGKAAGMLVVKGCELVVVARELGSYS